MYAGVVMYQIKPGKKGVATAIWKDSFLPAAAKQKEFKGGLWLVNREENAALGIDLWGNDISVSTFQSSGLFNQLAAKFEEVLDRPPVRIEYEAVAEIPMSAAMAQSIPQSPSDASPPGQQGKFKILDTLRHWKYKDQP